MSERKNKIYLTFSTFGKIGLAAVMVLFFAAQRFFPALNVSFGHRHHHSIWFFVVAALVSVPCFLIKRKNILGLNDKFFKKINDGDLGVIILFILLILAVGYQILV